MLSNRRRSLDAFGAGEGILFVRHTAERNSVYVVTKQLRNGPPCTLLHRRKALLCSITVAVPNRARIVRHSASHRRYPPTKGRWEDVDNGATLGADGCASTAPFLTGEQRTVTEERAIAKEDGARLAEDQPASCALSEILPRVRNSPPPPEGSSDQLITEHLLIVTDLSNMIPEMAIAPPPAKPY
eukprot:3936824-Prymnesium_polylepis.2